MGDLPVTDLRRKATMTVRGHRFPACCACPWHNLDCQAAACRWSKFPFDDLPGSRILYATTHGRSSADRCRRLIPEGADGLIKAKPSASQPPYHLTTTFEETRTAIVSSSSATIARFRRHSHNRRGICSIGTAHRCAPRYVEVRRSTQVYPFTTRGMYEIGQYCCLCRHACAPCLRFSCWLHPRKARRRLLKSRLPFSKTCLR